jgi:hypothetical protein
MSSERFTALAWLHRTHHSTSAAAHGVSHFGMPTRVCQHPVWSRNVAATLHSGAGLDGFKPAVQARVAGCQRYACTTGS